MSGRPIPSAIVAALAATSLVGCTYEPAPTYSYYAVPCAPSPAVGASPAPDAASPGDAAAPPTAPSCIAAVPNYTFPPGSYPYWDYGWPYYGDIGVGGFIGGDFGHRFHDRDFRDHDFRDHAFHGHAFHGGSRSGGLHGGGGHGGRG